MLDFSFWSIFWAVFNVIVLFILLRIFLFKPINKIRDERTRTIQNDLDSARKAKDEAEELRQQYENSISDAKEQANQIMMRMRTLSPRELPSSGSLRRRLTGSLQTLTRPLKTKGSACSVRLSQRSLIWLSKPLPRSSVRTWTTKRTASSLISSFPKRREINERFRQRVPEGACPS